MTEAEWLACADPRLMLEFPWAHVKVSERKLRLFAAAAFHRRFLKQVSHGLVPERDCECRAAGRRGSLSASEIDKLPGTRQRTAPGSTTSRVLACRKRDTSTWPSPICSARVRPIKLPGMSTLWAPGNPTTHTAPWPPSCATSSATPFAPSPSPAVLHRHRRDMGAARCTSPASSAVMPILADALQDAGCDSADILDHCRGPGPHVRGCWVVDLVLGKE